VSRSSEPEKSHRCHACVSTGAKSGFSNRAEATKAQMRENVYYGYRTAIMRSGKWQFVSAGD
jgi:hypothetical protein